MTSRQSPQIPAGHSRMTRYSSICSYDEMEEDFVVLGDDAFEGDQTKYIPPSPLQLVTSTTWSSWNNLSLSSAQSRLNTIGAVAADNLASVVAGLRLQDAAGIIPPALKGLKTPVDDFDVWEPEEDIDDEGVEIDMEYPKSKGYQVPYSDTKHDIYSRHHRSPQEHNTKLRTQEEAGPRFQQEEQEYDSLGVSIAWQRDVKQKDSKKRKQKLLAEWQQKEEKGAERKQLNINADAGLPSANIPRKNGKTNQQKQTSRCAHTEVHQEEEGSSSVAGMQRDAHVTISLPSSNQVTVQRSSTKRRAGSSVFYGLCAQLRAPPRTDKDTVELKMSDRCWEIDIERLRYCD